MTRSKIRVVFFATVLIISYPFPVRAEPPVEPLPPSEAAFIPEARGITYLRRPQPGYPASAKANKEEGMVILRALIDESGQVKTVLITKSSGSSSLDLAAKNAVLNASCNPYIVNGKATPAYISIPITFKLEDKNIFKPTADGSAAAGISERK